MHRQTWTWLWVAVAMAAGVAFVPGSLSPAWAQDTFLDGAQAGAEFARQGEYLGTAGTGLFGVQLVALGEGKYQGVLYAKGLPGGTWDNKTRLALTGETADAKVHLKGQNCVAVLQDNVLKGELDG
ncbi:MAG: hypothetical protein ACKO3P_03880, partial [Planctomycetaceae bacterium]